MRQAMRSAVVPAYILLCMVFGGSVQGIWHVAALQLLAITIIGWSLLVREPLPLSKPAKALFVLVGLTVLLIILQSIPLPPAIWTALPGREHIVEGYELLRQPIPWLSVSLTPYDTGGSALALLPPLAVLTAMLVGGAYRASWIAIAVLVGTFAAVLLGALQVGSAGDPSSWYLYKRTNQGLAVGFFANSNHMATLLVISIPLQFALIADFRKRGPNTKARSAVTLLGIAWIPVLLVGIFLNGSLAVLLMGLPVLLISATMLMPQRLRTTAPVGAVSVISIIAIGMVFMTPLHDRLISSNVTSFEVRQTVWQNTIPAIKDHGMFGSGLGSFQKVYQQYEDQGAVAPTLASHAHNDYLETVLETGLPGLLFLLLFCIWWGGRTAQIWRMSAVPYAQAATIGSAALLLHSLVDYPLRTPALSAIMAGLLAMMARPQKRVAEEVDDLWPTRHLSA